MKKFFVIITLFISSHFAQAADLFSIKVDKAEKLSVDSLFFQLIDQQRVIENDGIVKLDIFHSPSGYREQKMAWMETGICNQYVSFKGLKDGKLFIRATTTFGDVENSKSEFLIFLEDAKIISIQDVYSNELPTLRVEAELGELLEGFSNKIAISTLNSKTGKLQKEQVSITTENGDTLSKFTVPGKRLIDMYLEKGKKYYLQTTSVNKPIELKGTSYGYGIKCKQIEDSIDIEIFRGKQQPVEKLHFCLQVNNKLDTIASFVFDDSLFIMNTRFYWPKISNQHISFLLMNNDSYVLAKRYWEPDNNLLQLSPFYTKLDTHTISIDSAFTMQFTCKGCDREKITYQVTDKDNILSSIGQVQWLSDSVFSINNLQLVGKGYLVFGVDRNNINWKPIIQIIPLPIPKPSPIFYVNADDIKSLVNNNIVNPKDMVDVVTKNDLLPDVTVTGIKKTRIEELEEKYVNNKMLTSLFSVNINVLDDESSRNGLTLLKYVSQKIPITQLKIVGSMYTPSIKREALYFRGGEVEYWIDEIFYAGESGAQLANNIFAGDVAYIKLIKKPIRGLVGSGGNLLRGESLAPQGALVIYTKKGDEKELDKRFNQRVAIAGIQILE
ncbi:MAG: hypothetical protein IKD55_11055 [Sediminibacterium sp.]|nr:hypothetical protein [Sediminibacterium sp.]